VKCGSPFCVLHGGTRLSHTKRTGKNCNRPQQWRLYSCMHKCRQSCFSSRGVGRKHQKVIRCIIPSSQQSNKRAINQTRETTHQVYLPITLAFLELLAWPNAHCHGEEVQVCFHKRNEASQSQKSTEKMFSTCALGEHNRASFSFSAISLPLARSLSF
jgi:hypothetical protein